MKRKRDRAHQQQQETSTTETLLAIAMATLRHQLVLLIVGVNNRKVAQCGML